MSDYSQRIEEVTSEMLEFNKNKNKVNNAINQLKKEVNSALEETSLKLSINKQKKLFFNCSRRKSGDLTYDGHLYLEKQHIRTFRSIDPYNTKAILQVIFDCLLERKEFIVDEINS